MPERPPASSVLDDLAARGLVHDATDLAVLGDRLVQTSIGVYVGFDPTADSLHAGHLLGQLNLRRFQLAGHRPFPLAGGATGMIGDPGGRSEERNLLDEETLRANVASIERQLSTLLDFEPGPFAATLVNNADWTAPMSALEFLRDVGKHVTVNQMVAKDSVRSRMTSDHGISYTEFSYMLLQANDFRWLHRHHGVELQMGGSDQWGNITTGIELVRKTEGATVHGITWPLLTKSDGSKFGKTASGAVWLDPARTSPYAFRQFWFAAEDDHVERYLKQFTFLPVAEIDELLERHQRDPGRREAQRRLAHEVTTLVHGAAASVAAAAAADVLFYGGDLRAASVEVFDVLAAELATTTVSAAELDHELDLGALLVRTGVASSNADVRRSLPQRQFAVNGTKLEAPAPLAPSLLHGRYLLLQRGKATHHLVIVA